MELCLGTVQFGLDYGIIGQKKPSVEDSIKCLDYATQHGIKAIDTATAYGTSEQVTGEFIKKKTIPRSSLFIGTKLTPNVLDDYEESNYYGIIKSHLVKSLQTLGVDYLDYYLLHSARYAHKENILDALYLMKKEGLAKKVGVSVYEPEEAFACLNNDKVDYMQLPYSIFDHRMKKAGVFDNEKIYTVEIDARSAFLQGLILLNEDQVPTYLNDAKPIVKKIIKLCNNNNLDRVHLAMAYIKQQKNISHLVFGVDNIKQLKQNIAFFDKEIDKQLLAEIGKEFENIKAEVVMPSLWKR